MANPSPAGQELPCLPDPRARRLEEADAVPVLSSPLLVHITGARSANGVVSYISMSSSRRTHEDIAGTAGISYMSWASRTEGRVLPSLAPGTTSVHQD